MLHRSGRHIGMGIALFSLVLPLLRVCVRGLVRFEGPGVRREPVGGAVLRRLLAFLLALIVAVSVVPFVGSPVHAAPPAGSLDPTFGIGGKVTTDIGGGAAQSVAVQADGKIVVGGQGSSDFAVVRYNPDGSLDSSFDEDGIALTDIGDSVTEGAHAISVQSDGKIVAVGVGGNSSFAAVRYNSDGSLDTAFGGDGIVTHPSAPTPVAMALQDDDKIVTVGGHGGLALVRLNSDGSLDTSFDDDGMVTTDLGFHSAAAHGVVIQSGGKIVIVGGTDQVTSSQSAFVVARYLSTGALDKTFGDDGIVTANPLGTGGFFEDVALDGDGKIVAVGRPAGAAALARFNADGSLDATFDGDGIAIGTGQALAVQSDNRIVTTAIYGSGWEVSRYLTDGSPDTSFGADGVVTTNDTFTYAIDVALQADGGIVVVGWASSPAFAVARYVRGNRPPVADAGSDQSVKWTAGGTSVTLDGTGSADPDGDKLTYTWSGGFAGGTAIGDMATVVFDFPGVYEATLVVDDGKGATDSDTVTISMSNHDVGLVDASTGMWYLRHSEDSGKSFFYGNPGDVPFLGDWDCDGVATPGLFRTSDAFAYLRNSNSQGIADVRFFFGNPSDIPLAGDFNGDGCDTLSIYRPSEARFYIMNKLGENEGGLGAADYSFLFGNVGDKPVVGDWDGDGIDEIGLHRETTGFFYYRNTLTTGVADGQLFFGDPGDQFVAGDWGVVDGVDTPGMFRPSNSTFYFRHTLTQGNADSQFTWTGAGTGWLPVSGDFTLD